MINTNLENDTSQQWIVAALYRFVALQNLPVLQKQIKDFCDAHDICGTLLIASEGINGTVAGQNNAIPQLIELLDTIAGVRKGELKYSSSEEKPFRRIKVRLKKEIITMKAEEANPTKLVGQYVTPSEWNDLVNDPDVTLVDTRNNYETAVGIFKDAIDPNIETFTEFKDFVQDKMDPKKQKKVAMFCTGGIRCEKASSYMLAHGFEEVYHLQGGILKYLEEIPAEQSQWQGDCFVFDRRVAVGQDLKESPYQICYGCRWPLTEEDVQANSYEKGVSCPHCIDKMTEERARSFRMRHEQMKKAGEEIPGDNTAL